MIGIVFSPASSKILLPVNYVPLIKLAYIKLASFISSKTYYYQRNITIHLFHNYSNIFLNRTLNMHQKTEKLSLHN